MQDRLIDGADLQLDGAGIVEGFGKRDVGPAQNAAHPCRR